MLMWGPLLIVIETNGVNQIEALQSVFCFSLAFNRYRSILRQKTAIIGSQAECSDNKELLMYICVPGLVN